MLNSNYRLIGGVMKINTSLISLLFLAVVVCLTGCQGQEEVNKQHSFIQIHSDEVSIMPSDSQALQDESTLVKPDVKNIGELESQRQTDKKLDSKSNHDKNKEGQVTDKKEKNLTRSASKKQGQGHDLDVSNQSSSSKLKHDDKKDVSKNSKAGHPAMDKRADSKKESDVKKAGTHPSELEDPTSSTAVLEAEQDENKDSVQEAKKKTNLSYLDFKGYYVHFTQDPFASKVDQALIIKDGNVTIINYETQEETQASIQKYSIEDQLLTLTGVDQILDDQSFDVKTTHLYHKELKLDYYESSKFLMDLEDNDKIYHFIAKDEDAFDQEMKQYLKK